MVNKAKEQHTLLDRISRCEAAFALCNEPLAPMPREQVLKQILVLQPDLPTAPSGLQIGLTGKLIQEELRDIPAISQETEAVTRMQDLASRICCPTLTGIAEDGRKSNAMLPICSVHKPSFGPLLQNLLEKIQQTEGGEDNMLLFMDEATDGKEDLAFQDIDNETQVPTAA